MSRTATSTWIPLKSLSSVALPKPLAVEKGFGRQTSTAKPELTEWSLLNIELGAAKGAHCSTWKGRIDTVSRRHCAPLFPLMSTITTPESTSRNCWSSILPGAWFTERAAGVINQFCPAKLVASIMGFSPSYSTVVEQTHVPESPSSRRTPLIGVGRTLAP